MDDPKRGHRSVLVAALIALAVAAIIWVWLTARGSATGFPQPILTAEGLLLTALVFVAGLGQGNVRRATDAALAELHRRDDSMLGSYTDHTSPVPTLKLFEWATLAEREIQTIRKMSWRASRDVYRRYSNLPRDRTLAFDSLVDLYRIENEMARLPGAPNAPSPKRRKFLDRKQRKVEAQRTRIINRIREVEKQVGATGEAVLPGRLLVALGTVSDLFMLAFSFILAMVSLFAVGIIYAGWGFTGSPQAELWATLAILGLAVSYVVVLRADIEREWRATVGALRDSWLVSLSDAERSLCSLSRKMSTGFNRSLMEELNASLRHAERSGADLPWAKSLRGRAELYDAVPVGGILESGIRLHDDSYVERRLEQHLRVAEPLLQAASERGDDPVADVALARALQLRFLLEEDEECLTRSRGLLSHAASLLEQGYSGGHNYDPDIFVRGPLRARAWLQSQEWLWPAEEAERQLLGLRC